MEIDRERERKREREREREREHARENLSTSCGPQDQHNCHSFNSSASSGSVAGHVLLGLAVSSLYAAHVRA